MVCDEGKKNVLYGFNCSGPCRTCEHCGQSVCEYHGLTNTKGIAGGHSDCTGLQCETSSIYKHMCSGTIETCTRCGHCFCSYHKNPVVNAVVDLKAGHVCTSTVLAKAAGVKEDGRAVKSTRTEQHRFESFAPVCFPSPATDQAVLNGSWVRFLICGRATFRKIAEAMLFARHEIFVLGWFISPHLPLVRDGSALPGQADSRLSALLKGAADRGVHVRVLVYHETKQALPNDSEWAEAELQHPNILVVRHRSELSGNRMWSHHEKVVLVDQQLAFVGGIDLCLGRYCDPSHQLHDPPGPTGFTWKGQDYSNPRISDFTDVRSGTDVLDRSKQPRTPWQDIACVVLGAPARSVAHHCVERWNYAKDTTRQYNQYPTLCLWEEAALCNEEMLKLLAEEIDEEVWPPEVGSWEPSESQIVRSVGSWSAGTTTETSVQAAYCDLIQRAEQYIYIENQFLCSGMEGDNEITNRVMEALFQRVMRAHTCCEVFHVMVVLPLLPALDGAIAVQLNSPLLFVMHWQFRTMRSFRERLKQAGVTMSDFVSFYGLRTHGVLDGVTGEGVQEQTWVTEEVYVHSKVMVVDDRISVVGSANLNDRSLLGMRDSEVCVVLQDTVMMESDLGGPRQVGSFSSGLRKALFAQHMGWSRADLEGRFKDPLADSTMNEIRDIAAGNTQIFDQVFGALPSNRVRSWVQLETLRGETGLRGDVTKEAPRTEEEATALGGICGHLVEFPLDFLIDEDLSPKMMSLGSWVPECFK